MIMEKVILVVSADEEECRVLSDFLKEQYFSSISIYSLTDMIKIINNKQCLVAIMDIDSIPIDNRTIRELTITYPDIYFLCLSSNRFHPHLKESLCYHIYACINKPVDPDELIYWVRSIYKNESGSNNHCKV
jgi:DNA-binding NtrC family response regulator